MALKPAIVPADKIIEWAEANDMEWTIQAYQGVNEILMEDGSLVDVSDNVRLKNSYVYFNNNPTIAASNKLVFLDGSQSRFNVIVVNFKGYLLRHFIQFCVSLQRKPMAMDHLGNIYDRAFLFQFDELIELEGFLF